MNKGMENSDQRNNRTCPCCSEIIPAAAKICPRCRQWLSVRSFRNPTVLALFIFLPMIVSLILMISWMVKQMQKVFNPPPYYSDFQGSIQILDSKMRWVETSDGPRVFVTGTITNRSQFAWGRPEFECRFFDSKKQMIDAATESTYLTIMPGSDSAFRVSIKPLLSSNEYDSFKIFLSTAYTARGP